MESPYFSDEENKSLERGSDVLNVTSYTALWQK